jgi:dipeptidyl aminopeptidase/acylaminoacyl peptidase
LKKWTEQNANYKAHVLACCSNCDDEMAARSPISYVDTIAKANLKIFHGKYDSVVPVIQSIEFYQQVFEKYPKSRVFLDIFDGGHQIDMEAAMYWLLSQYNGQLQIDVTG